MSNKPTVFARNLEKTFYLSRGGNENLLSPLSMKVKVDAVKPISFVAYAGESIGIVGKNGSGKSTLLSMIAGNENPTGGDILVSSPPSLLSVSAVLRPHLSGYENVKIGLLAQGLCPQAVEEKYREVAEWADIGTAVNRPLKTYSSGMKARLKFAIATSVYSEILLVDEALSTGDAAFAARAKHRMSEFLDKSGTVFIVSHAPTTIKEYCSRALWLHEGALIADGPAKKVSGQYREWSAMISNDRRQHAENFISEIQREYAPPELLLSSESLVDRDT